MFWYPSQDLCLDTILSLSSTDNSFDLMPCLLLRHALSTVRPYIDRCVPFQIMSNQLNLPLLDSKLSKQHLKDDQWKQDAPELNFESHSNGSVICKNVKKPVFALSLWGIVCRCLFI